MILDTSLLKAVESKGYTLKSTIKDNVLVVTKANKDYVYKTSEKRWETFSSFSGKLLNLSGITKQNFSNEIAIHQMLSTHTFKSLKVASLYETDGKSYMIMDFIEGSMGRWYTQDMDRVLISSLVDLQLSITKYKSNIKRSPLSFLRKPFWNVIRTIGTIVFPKLGIKNAFKCFLLCIALERNVSQNKSDLLLHKDINNKGNIITDPQGQMYFIDFESCLRESKWILTDIVEIIYSFKDEYMDVELFKIYMQKMRNEGFIDESFDIKSHVRFAMLRNAIKYIGFNELYETHKNQLLNIILPDVKFDSWYKETFETENVTLS